MPIFLLIVSLLVWPAAARADFWIQAAPKGEAEEALHAAAGTRDPAARAHALAAVAGAHAGTPVAGLAWLGAALAHIEAGRPGEAEAALRQPDVKLTALADRALMTTARAREVARQDESAARTYESVLESHPQTPLRCDVLSRAADAWSRSSQRDRSAPLLHTILAECPGWEPSALLRLGQYYESRGRLREAFDHYDRLDCDYPTSPRAPEGAKRLAALRRQVPPLPAAERFSRDLRKAAALSEAGRHKQAAPLLRSLLSRTPPSVADAEIVRMRLARALLALDKETDALSVLQVIPSGSVFAAEAAFLRARARAARERQPYAYESVVSAHPNTEWAEEALLSLAHHYLKDARYAEAVPYFQRMLATFPDGRYLERASWWTGWWEYLSGRMESAAAIYENVAAKRPESLSSAGALYWAGRAWQRLGQHEKSQELFAETVRRFKHTYHGLRAGEELGLLREGASSTHPADRPRGDGTDEVTEPGRTRVRQLLLIERLDEAMAELERVTGSAEGQATIAWIHWKQGRLRPAITAMRRAYPNWRSEAGDRLPFAVWRILYPLDYEEALVARAGDQELDAALVAGLIWQESAFDPDALSVAGARGLMQLLPSTGRVLARRLGNRRLRPHDLNDPAQNLRLGSLYLKNMIGRFGGRVERALAAYNAGPTRVVRWTSARRDMPAEEFIESIPFVETRNYVMNVLAHRAQYRRLYALPEKPQPGVLIAQAAPPEPAPRVASKPKKSPTRSVTARKATAAKARQVRGGGSKARSARKPARKRAPSRRR